MDPVERLKAQLANEQAEAEEAEKQLAETNSGIAKLLLDPARAATSDLLASMIYLAVTSDGSQQMAGVIAELDLRIPPRCTDKPPKVVDEK